MGKQPRHRPQRKFPDAKRIIVECELGNCVYCGHSLEPRKPWHMRKYVQTLEEAVFVAGKSKECVNPACVHPGKHYYASGVLMISLPHSTYGLDVLAFIGWQHEHEHRQLIEIQQELQDREIMISERTVGRLYRQFLALLEAMSEQTRQKLERTAAEHGGLIWAIDALQPQGHGTLLYVLYEALSGTPLSAIQLDHATTEQLLEWLQPIKALSLPVLATLSDGEDAIIAALKGCWPEAPHQRCQSHILGNLVEPVLKHDAQLRQDMYNDLGELPKVPDNPDTTLVLIRDGQKETAPPFFP